jgi:hypothetical protein
MSYSPGIGLLLNLGLDSSGVGPGLDDADKTLNDFAEKTAKDFESAGERTDKALLSNRESVRLLTEEMGIHLPRAVSGAVAEMLPGINSLGPALLGAFAIAEIPKFIHWVGDATAALGGYTEAVRAAEKADIDASNSALIHFKTIAQGAKFIADTNRELAQLAAKQGSWKTDIEGASKAMNDTKGILLSLLGPVGEGINQWRGYNGAVKEVGDTESEAAKLRQRLIEQLNQMTLLVAKQTTSTAANTEITERNTMTVRRWHEEMIKAGQEAGKVAKEIAKANDEATASYIRLAKAELQFTLDLEKLGIVDEQNLNFLKQYTPAMQAATTQTQHLAEARKFLAGVTQDLTKVEAAFKQATQGERQAMDSMMEGAEQFGEAIASMTGSTRAVAYVRGSYDAAKAIECMAAYIESYGTDMPQLLASVQWAAAAEQQFAVAGRGSSRGASTGGGGGSASRMGGQGSPEAPGAMGTEVPITPGFTSVGSSAPMPSGNLHVAVFGESTAATWLVNTINKGVMRNGLQLQTGTRPKAGR